MVQNNGKCEGIIFDFLGAAEVAGTRGLSCMYLDTLVLFPVIIYLLFCMYLLADRCSHSICSICKR